ncbi:PEP-CTERM sorting domain-containing protein [Aestuariibacter sp. A3R04]|uniref:PEP-CTERM sorting domain-containing protein n=1 Tax=Aestuariibacter sp. A3R04 TaxID=2841571 RepID=UPI001C09AF3B|nr:PEP-CTERM sorting domain-containing protein [Aestuariibacter sp. A3R04]MBU3021294.1 PEP-CTERM sorting domain-containing protein [Aestuariibacter sp. A3R04]
MKTLRFFSLTIVLFLVTSVANAALIRFNATGVAGVSGFVEIDDSLFDGTSSQFVSNSFFTDLSLDVFGELFSLADVVTTDNTIFDSTGTIPVIVNGAGNLADNGMTAIAFFPDGFDGTAFDGDASLATGASGSLADSDFFAVKWEVATEVPEPSAFLLFSAGLLFLVRRKIK